MFANKSKTSEEDKNRTGITAHPEHGQELVSAARQVEPSTKGDSSAIAVERAHFLRQVSSIGSLPTPAAGPPRPGETRSPLLAELLDKLGERLVFERGAVRLYEALIEKRKAADEGENRNPGEPGSLPSEKDLQKICDDEFVHYKLIEKAILDLGGDPTVLTPSADIALIIGQGLPNVLTDPRTDLAQALQAILAAELQDNDGWRMLIKLSRAAGQKNLAPMMDCCLRDEEAHLKLVRGWLSLKNPRR